MIPFSDRAMKKIFTFLGAAAFAVQGAFALISVPTSFPLDKVNGASATQKDQVAMLLSRYENDVVLLINPVTSYSKEVQAVNAVPATVDKLKALATSGGATLTSDSISAAVAALVRQNPSDAPAIVASAIELLKGTPGGQSAENQEKLARSAIKSLPEGLTDEPKLITFIIGVSAENLKNAEVVELVKSLRNFAIDSEPERQQPKQALALDEQLVNEGIVTSYAASPEFLAWADNFAQGQLAETFFSGDQGAIDQGAVFAPGSPGSPGGAGSTGNQIAPNRVDPPPAS